MWLFATPWTVAHKAPLSVEFPRQEYWSGLPFPSPGDIPDPGIEPESPTLQAWSLPLSHLGSTYRVQAPALSSGQFCPNYSRTPSYIWLGFSGAYAVLRCVSAWGEKGLFFFLIFIYLAEPGLSWSMWDLVPWPWIKPGPPELGTRNSHWTTREVPQITYPITMSVHTGSHMSWMRQEAYGFPNYPHWKWKLLSRVWLFVTPWTIQSMEFSRPAYWSG